jgi:hypothetical protein
MSDLVQGNNTSESKKGSPKDNSSAKEWGPALWKIIHTMAAAYPDNPNTQVKASCRQFFYSLRHLLPCPTCRQHYTNLLSKKQPQVNSAEDVQKWALWVHNEINARLHYGKPWTYDDLCNVYPPTNAGEDLEDTNTIHMESLSDNLNGDISNVKSQSDVMRKIRLPTPPSKPKSSSVKSKAKNLELFKKAIVKAGLNSLRQYGIPGNIPPSTFTRFTQKLTPKLKPKRQVLRAVQPHSDVSQSISAKSKNIQNNNRNVKISRSIQEVRSRGKKKKKDCGCGK